MNDSELHKPSIKGSVDESDGSVHGEGQKSVLNPVKPGQKTSREAFCQLQEEDK